MHTSGILSLVILLLAGADGSLRRESSACQESIVTADHLEDSAWSEAASQVNKLDCLPTGVRSGEVVSYGRNSKPNVTVEKKLIEMSTQLSEMSEELSLNDVFNLTVTTAAGSISGTLTGTGFVPSL